MVYARLCVASIIFQHVLAEPEMPILPLLSLPFEGRGNFLNCGCCLASLHGGLSLGKESGRYGRFCKLIQDVDVFLVCFCHRCMVDRQIRDSRQKSRNMQAWNLCSLAAFSANIVFGCR